MHISGKCMQTKIHACKRTYVQDTLCKHNYCKSNCKHYSKILKPSHFRAKSTRRVSRPSLRPSSCHPQSVSTQRLEKARLQAHPFKAILLRLAHLQDHGRSKLAVENFQGQAASELRS